MEGQELLPFLFGGGGKRLYALFYNVFSDVIFYPRVLQESQVLKTIPASACLVTLVALMIWHNA